MSTPKQILSPESINKHIFAILILCILTVFFLGTILGSMLTYYFSESKEKENCVTILETIQDELEEELNGEDADTSSDENR